MSRNPRTITDWIQAYADAWTSRDPESAARLFTEDAVYRSSPFREPHVGQAAIRAYWSKATGDQRNVELRFGTPVIEGLRAAVEWWAVLALAEGTKGTLPGCLVLRFASDGRCEELREYWHWEEKEVAAPKGWGA